MERSEASIERECVEWVFGLTGGELADKRLDYQDATDEPHKPDSTFRYHYDGLPEWCMSDYADRFDGGIDYFTAVTCCLYGAPPERIRTTDGKVYVRGELYQNSGETQCPCIDAEGADPYQGVRCELCERADGEEHGCIYLGDGWCEVVYRYSEQDELSALASAHNAVVWEEAIAELECAADNCGDTSEVPGTGLQGSWEECPSCGGKVTSKLTGRKGWWWWTCLPGCLPDSDVSGPHDSALDALRDATDGLE